MLRGIIYSLLFISSSLYAQDSTKLYPIPKYKLDRLLDIFHYDYPACQQSNKDLSTALDSMKYALHVADTLIQIRTLERDLKVEECNSWRHLTEVNKSIHKSETRQIRRQRNKLLLGLGVESILLIIIIL